MSRMKPLSLDTSGMSVEDMEGWGRDLTDLQKSINWWIGDLARAAKAKLGEDNYSQAFPPDTSPGLVQRCEAIARAYPSEKDRNPLATWTQHMQVANKPDRAALVDAMVSSGLTSDESRKTRTAGDKQRWCLAIDVNYFLHRFWFSGAGVESAVGVASWIQRSVERLKEKGLTDVACCFDSTVNNRKQLTEEWEDKYKNRPQKDAELVQQLQLVEELLKGHSFACIKEDGMEADDVMASIAKQFAGRVTLMTQDKDCRQCLSDKCNMLLDIEWVKDENGGYDLPEYKWLSAKQHTETTGIPPSQWTQYQAIMGDAADGIKGAEGIGAKGAADLIKTFGTVEAAIQAAKDSDERIKPKQRAALVGFELKSEVTLKLVTLIDSLPVSVATGI